MGDKARELPWDLDLEQAALGALLVDERAYWTVADRLSAGDLFDPLHQRIFEVIGRIANTGAAPSPLSVGSALANDGGLAQVGGKAYLVSLARSASLKPNLADYARIIRAHRQRRDLIGIAEQMLADAYDPSVEPVVTADQAGEALHDATHLGDPGKGPQSIVDLAHEAVKRAEEAKADPLKVSLSTGLKTVDSGIGRLFRGDLTVLGAATSQGKTSLIQKFLLTNALAGFGALFFSLEMSGVSIATRYIAEEVGVPANRIREGNTTDPEFERIVRAPMAFGDIARRLKIDDTSALSVAQMRARAMAFKRKCPELALVVMDHLQYIVPADPRATVDEQSRQITRDLCAFAKDLNVALVLISHLTKENERRNSKRPIMSDLYGSGGIAQNADSVWFIYRAHYYLTREEPDASDQKAYDTWMRQCAQEEGWAEIFSTKARMSKTSSVRVRFREDTTTFYDPAPKEPVTKLSEQDTMALTGGRMK